MVLGLRLTSSISSLFFKLLQALGFLHLCTFEPLSAFHVGQRFFSVFGTSILPTTYQPPRTSADHSNSVSDSIPGVCCWSNKHVFLRLFVHQHSVLSCIVRSARFDSRSTSASQYFGSFCARTEGASRFHFYMLPCIVRSSQLDSRSISASQNFDSF